MLRKSKPADARGARDGPCFRPLESQQFLNTVDCSVYFHNHRVQGS